MASDADIINVFSTLMFCSQQYLCEFSWPVWSLFDDTVPVFYTVCYYVCIVCSSYRGALLFGRLTYFYFHLCRFCCDRCNHVYCCTRLENWRDNDEHISTMLDHNEKAAYNQVYNCSRSILLYYPPTLIGGGIKRWCYLTSVCLSVCRVHRA